MPNTTNFNWATPADTDLVKDGAAAIRTLGNSIDSSFVDLKGGTTGQILSKASNTDLDFTFVTPNVGDITEVQAGTGISVASGTGPIPVVTNTVATAIDAKGDLIVGTGADAFSRLAVGATNGMVLTVDSGEATGLKYAAPAGGGKVLQVIQAQTTTDTTIATTTPTDTTITATITPSAASSKVLGIINGQCRYNRTQTAIGIGGIVKRGATTIVDYEGYGLSYTQVNNSSSGVATGGTFNIAYLDSPSTTSATTYKLQAQVSTTADSGTSTWQVDAPSQIILMEIGA